MKTQIAYAIIGILVASQLYASVKINSLQNKLERLEHTVESNTNYLQGEIHDIYQEVEQQLEEQASLIQDVSIDIGKINTSTFKVPVTFTIQPKVVTETMSVALDIEGEIVQFNKLGLQYAQTREFEIDDSIYSKIIIEDKGIKSIEEHRALRGVSIVDKVCPVMNAHFSGHTSFNSKGYRVTGCLDIDYKPSEEENYFEDMKYVIKVDDKIIKETPIVMEENRGESYSFDIDETYAINDGQVLTANMIAVDSLGLTYEYLVMHFVAGAKAQREPYFKKVSITAPDGKIIYQLDETKSSYKK